MADSVQSKYLHTHTHTLIGSTMYMKQYNYSRNVITGGPHIKCLAKFLLRRCPAYVASYTYILYVMCRYTYTHIALTVLCIWTFVHIKLYIFAARSLEASIVSICSIYSYVLYTM